MDENTGIFGYLMELNEVLAQENVQMERGDPEGLANFEQDENQVTFQGVILTKMNIANNFDQEEYTQNANQGKMRQQGRYALALLHGIEGYDQQLYSFYQIQNKVNMDFFVCFAGASEKELKTITNKIKILNEITLLKDGQKKASELLAKQNTDVRFYLINKEGLIYNTADNVTILEQLVKNEFGDRFYEQTEMGAYIEVNNPAHITYEGRIYRYLNKHLMPTQKMHRHVTLVFVRVPPVTKISNYEELKMQLSQMGEMERNYPQNVVVLCLLGLDEENVRQISQLTGLLKKVQVMLDNNTQIRHVWKKLGMKESNKLVMEIHSFDDVLMPILDPNTLQSTERVFTRFDEAELFLHDFDYKLTDAMPNVPEPKKREK